MSSMYEHPRGDSWGDFTPLEKSGPKPWDPVPLGPGFARLGAAVRMLLSVLAVVTVAEIAVYGWGLSMFDDAFAAGDYERLSSYDDLDQLTSIAWFAAILAAGITWMIWQYKLAKSASPRDLRRGPGWHAFAWITPIVGLWFPYQNIKDLWRRRFPERSTLILGVWWTGYVITNLLDRIYVRAIDDADSLDEFKGLVGVELASAVISLGALLLAILIHRGLSEAETSAQLTPEASPVG